MKIWAILPAAGIGRRMGSSTPKQYHSLCGTPVLIHSINRLLDIPEIEHLVVVLHPEDQHWSTLDYKNEKVSTVQGGDERFQSVINGLQSLAEKAAADDWVLVHDAVRPCVSREDIAKLIDAIGDSEIGGLLGAPINNTVKKIGSNSEVEQTIDRSELWSAFTPQMFRFQLLNDALTNAVNATLNITDEASAVEALGRKPIMVSGKSSNIKITHDADLELAKFYLSGGDER